jgi:hypothetical protein
MNARFSLLRAATANELVPGGVWYRKEANGSYSTVITSLPACEEKAAVYREQLKSDSENGLIFLRKDKPNYPLEESSELFFNDYNRMVKVEINANMKNQKQQHMEPVVIMYSKTEHGSTEAHRKRIMDELDNLPQGNYAIKIQSNDIKGNPRGRYFAILKVIETDTGNDTDMLHDMFKKMYNDGQSTNVFTNDRQWYDYINKVKAFAEPQMGVALPDPKAMTYEQLEHIDAQYNRSFNY